MKIFILASGSSGNCSVVTDGETRVLIDAGIGPRILKSRLDQIGIGWKDIDRILLTHAHSDHISKLPAIAAHTGAAVVCSIGTARELGASEDFEIETFVPGETFRLGTIKVGSFGVEHDAADTCGFVFGEERELGYFTDAGTLTPTLLRSLSGCRAVVCEANYDKDMLRLGPYPYYLKKRVAGASGHMSNEDCGRLLRALWSTGCRKAVLSHLSRTNNTPETALRTVTSCLEGREMELCCASVDGGASLIV